MVKTNSIVTRKKTTKTPTSTVIRVNKLDFRFMPILFILISI
jgi:hypothetical protein